MLQLIVAIAIMYLVWRIIRFTWTVAIFTNNRGRAESSAEDTPTPTPTSNSNPIRMTLTWIGACFLGLLFCALFSRQLIALAVYTVLIGITILFWIFFFGLIRTCYQALTSSEATAEAE